MDEPFSTLRQAYRPKDAWGAYSALAERRISMLFVTHNPLEAVYLADQVALMSPRLGRI